MGRTANGVFGWRGERFRPAGSGPAGKAATLGFRDRRPELAGMGSSAGCATLEVHGFQSLPRLGMIIAFSGFPSFAVPLPGSGLARNGFDIGFLPDRLPRAATWAPLPVVKPSKASVGIAAHLYSRSDPILYTRLPRSKFPRQVGRRVLRMRVRSGLQQARTRSCGQRQGIGRNRRRDAAMVGFDSGCKAGKEAEKEYRWDVTT